MKLIIKILALLSLVIATQYSYSASFNCAKASTRIEKLICADASLGRLDEQMSKAYFSQKNKLSSKLSKKALLSEQKQWLALRTNTCKELNLSCLTNLYNKRISELKSGDLKPKLGEITANNNTKNGLGYESLNKTEKRYYDKQLEVHFNNLLGGLTGLNNRHKSINDACEGVNSRILFPAIHYRDIKNAEKKTPTLKKHCIIKLSEKLKKVIATINKKKTNAKNCYQYGLAYDQGMWAQSKFDMKYRPFAKKDEVKLSLFSGTIIRIEDNLIYIQHYETIAILSINKMSERLQLLMLNPNNIAVGNKVSGFGYKLDNPLEVSYVNGAKVNVAEIEAICIQ